MAIACVLILVAKHCSGAEPINTALTEYWLLLSGENPDYPKFAVTEIKANTLVLIK